MTIKGRLTLAGRELYDTLDVELSIASNSPDVYVGEFSVPGTFDFDPDDHYVLSLNDGRNFGISLHELRLITNNGRIDHGVITSVSFRSE